MTDTHVLINEVSRDAEPSRAIAFLRWAASVLVYWHERRAQYMTIRELRKLNNRTLKDIGLNRSEINSVAFTSGRDRTGRFSVQSKTLR